MTQRGKSAGRWWEPRRPILRLYGELRGKAQVVRKAERARVLAAAEAVKAGEFDATKEESDRWAASKDGQDTTRALLGDPSEP